MDPVPSSFPFGIIAALVFVSTILKKFPCLALRNPSALSCTSPGTTLAEVQAAVKTADCFGASNAEGNIGAGMV